jgi:2-oxoglutarate ferredoxin oxidoreductase subunit delta
MYKEKKMRKGMKKIDRIRTPHIWADSRRCIACWECVGSCPGQVIGKVDFLWHKHIVLKNNDQCIGCRQCIRVCPRGVFSEKMPDLLRHILVRKDTSYL